MMGAVAVPSEHVDGKVAHCIFISFQKTNPYSIII